MSRSTRMFEVIQIIRESRGPVRARDLAERLEVTERTVYRDIAALQARRVPIEGAAGIGYVLRPGFSLPPLMFNDDEVEAIVVGLALLSRTNDRSLERAAASVSAKIAAVLPDERRASLDNGAVGASPWTAIPSTGIDVADLRHAVRAEQKLRIHYVSLGGEATERTIKPVAVFYYIEAVLLVGWCELRQDFRTFRVDRITAMTRLHDRFTGEGGLLRKQWERLKSDERVVRS